MSASENLTPKMLVQFTKPFAKNLKFNECEGIGYLDLGMPNNSPQNHFLSFLQGKNGEVANSPRLNIKICYQFIVYVYISLFYHGS